VFGLVGGSLADAMDRRRLVMVSTVGSIVLSTLLLGQSLTGVDSLPLVLGLVAASASCSALGSPARRSFVPAILHRDQVAAGIALNHLGFQAAMLTGPVLAGFVIADWGLPACYLLDAITFGIALYGIAGLPPMPPDEAAQRAGIRAIAAGCRYIASRPVLSGSFLSDLAATTLAMPVALFPAINADRFGGRPETLGLFFGAMALGGVAAGLLSGSITRAARIGAIQLGAAATWGVALTLLGITGQLWAALACLTVAGAADTIAVISRGAVVQLSTADAYRGRVSSVEQIVGVAGPELGNLRAGLTAGLTSAGFSAISGGLLGVLGVALVAAGHPSLRRFVAATGSVPGSAGDTTAGR
jgi:hypothetical protein